jgi:hypothetical protein
MLQDSDHAVLLPDLDITVDVEPSSGGDSGLITVGPDNVKLKKLPVGVPQICSVLFHSHSRNIPWLRQIASDANISPLVAMEGSQWASVYLLSLKSC